MKLFFGVLAGAALCLTGCITAYGQALNECVDKSATLQESQTCRCHVNEKYGRPCRPEADAGHDAR